MSCHDGQIASTATVLVAVYTPWCGHCKPLLAVAPLVAQALPAVRVALVGPHAACESLNTSQLDHDQNDVPVEFDALVQAYPTLLLFVHGIPLRYPGTAHHVEHLVSWVRAQTTALDGRRGEL